MTRHLQLRDSIVLLLPLLALVGLGLALRRRSETVQESPFRVVSADFRRLPGRGQASGGIGINVSIGYQGKPPTWWQTNITAQWLQNMRFVDGKGKEHPLSSFALQPIGYDHDKQSYILKTTGNIPTGYDASQEGQFKGTAIFANQLVPLKPLAIVRFSVPVQLK